MSLKEPRVTIGIPVFNGTDYLADALDSILAQTYTDFEVVISDNGSTDETPALCREYAARDPRIRFYGNEVNRGAAWNYNRVFELAQGEFFRWHGHDDLIAPTYLERCAAVLECDPDVAIAYPKSVIIDGYGNVIRSHDDNMDLREDDASQRIQRFHPGLCHPIFGLIRSQMLRETDLIGSFVGSDEVLLWQLILAGKFHEVPEVLFFRRFHEKASVVANPDFKSRAQWFDPTKTNAIYFKTWHHFYLKLQAIRNAPLSSREKRRVYAEFGKMHAAHPGFVVQDFITLRRHFLASRKSKPLEYWSEEGGASSTKGESAEKVGSR